MNSEIRTYKAACGSTVGLNIGHPQSPRRSSRCQELADQAAEEAAGKERLGP